MTLSSTSYPFAYPITSHTRRHGPTGYEAYGSYRPWLRDEFYFRCVYCLTREKWGYLAANWDLDHFLPQKLYPGKKVDYDNLVYSCHTCNTYKKKHLVPDPCAVCYGNELKVNSDGTIEALGAGGTRLIEVFRLDDDDHNQYRARFLDLAQRAAAAPDLLKSWMGFPEKLPDLTKLRAPGNTRPLGVNNSFHAQRKNGTLPDTY